MGDLLEGIKEFLDWNRYMTVCVSLWTFIVAYGVSNTQQILENCNTIGFILWCIGITLAIIGPFGELITDHMEYRRWKFIDADEEYKGPTLIDCSSQTASPPTACNVYGAILIRLFSNITIFFLIVTVSVMPWYALPHAEEGDKDIKPPEGFAGIGEKGECWMSITSLQEQSFSWLILSAITLLMRLSMIQYPEKEPQPTLVKFAPITEDVLLPQLYVLQQTHVRGALRKPPSKSKQTTPNVSNKTTDNNKTSAV